MLQLQMKFHVRVVFQSLHPHLVDCYLVSILSDVHICIELGKLRPFDAPLLHFICFVRGTIALSVWCAVNNCFCCSRADRVW